LEKQTCEKGDKVATGVDADGHRRVLGMQVTSS
jgi:transposase-like protein